MNTAQLITKAQLWLNPPFDNETQKKVKALIDSGNADFKDSFYKDMEFGTGGMRGIMGVGTNRINQYTLGRATQGLANYLKEQYPDTSDLKVVIAYDCRHNSKKFSKVVADVLTANGIITYLFDDLRTTPELSFSVRHLSCNAGIVLTASHNPPEYNGYKVYWNDGGQIVPPHDKNIINHVNKVAFDEINFNANDKLLKITGKEVDKAFHAKSVEKGTFNIPYRDNLKIVFTPIHGTSIMSVPEVLKQAGFSDVHVVKEQKKPDGGFPTVKSPNPEEPEALKMALDLANKIKADIVIGTDPDSDRLGIAVRDLDENLVLLNGNQTMAIMIEFLLKQWRQMGKLNGQQFIGTTIVSTPLIKDIASSYNVEVAEVLTGFKWIAKAIRDNEGSKEFIGGGEESFGFMVGDFIRDKDAVTATLLACEIAANAKNNNTTLYKELLFLFTKYGFYKEHLISIVKKGIDGAEQIKKMMSDLRNNPLKEIDGAKVKYIYDYDNSTRKNLLTGKQAPINLPKSNVLIYEAEDGTRLAARPSGTEPKIKFYFSVNLPLGKIEDTFTVNKLLNQKIDRIIDQMQLN
ncbi:MAG: phosphoglucomutase [Flavobacteriales bacterium]|nr:MAG: phosphoglucomutase [Flavobacteriales bacterium]PIE49297.1 MAG: phosphoglucomutase [Flavobacteriales bacterium]